VQKIRDFWRWGFKRWLIILVIIAGVIITNRIAPVRPHVQLPAEKLTHHPLFSLPVIGDFYLTNTLVATLIGDVIILGLALSVKRAVNRGEEILTGLAGVLEAIIEAAYDLLQNTAGKWAREIFPYFMTIILVVLVANWLEIIPGVDSIGILEPVDHGHPVEQVVPGVDTIVAGEADHGGSTLVPFVRVASTDLNFTIGIALFSVFMTQVIGVQAQGLGYFTKFFNFKRFFKLWTKKDLGPFDLIFPFTDIYVGLLELIAEFAKLISFSFRLFGNIFAGTMVLFVMGTLVPMVQSGFLLLEIFVGLIQAMVFGMLTMVFMTMATHAHDGH